MYQRKNNKNMVYGLCLITDQGPSKSIFIKINQWTCILVIMLYALVKENILISFLFFFCSIYRRGFPSWLSRQRDDSRISGGTRRLADYRYHHRTVANTLWQRQEKRQQKEENTNRKLYRTDINPHPRLLDCMVFLW